MVTPYYNKPTQEGLKAHYHAVVDAISIPLIIYDIPGRSVIRMSDDTLAELAQHPQIVGIKDATADCGRPTRILNQIGGQFAQLSGEDGTMLPYLAAGGHGVISVVSNIAPKLVADLQTAYLSGDTKTALELHQRLMPLHDGLFCEASPGPAKYAAQRLGLCEAETRLPLVPISEASRRIVDSALDQAGLL